jgi:hypothetical protein
VAFYLQNRKAEHAESDRQSVSIILRNRGRKQLNYAFVIDIIRVANSFEIRKMSFHIA